MKQRIFAERIPGPFVSLYVKVTGMVVKTYYPLIAQEILTHLKGGMMLDLGTGPGYLPIEITAHNS